MSRRTTAAAPAPGKVGRLQAVLAAGIAAHSAKTLNIDPEPIEAKRRRLPGEMIYEDEPNPDLEYMREGDDYAPSWASTSGKTRKVEDEAHRRKMEKKRAAAAAAAKGSKEDDDEEEDEEAELAELIRELAQKNNESPASE